MRGDRDGEREHQDEIPDGLRREPCSGPPAGCSAAPGFGLDYCHVGWPAPELMTIHAATATNSRNAKEHTREVISLRAAL
jgi:hypothetical protein